MSTSERLTLPYLQPSQAQKHVTHNEALQRLDVLVQLAVEGTDAATPPSLPADGETWALGAGPTGAWAGHAGALAAWMDNAWLFIVPQAGWQALDKTSGRLLRHDGSGWQDITAPDLANLAGVGINTGHDPVNRLSVSAAATLLSHEGAGHQVKLNKAASAETASLLFQTNWSGRAEIGTAGNDDFAIKVSADGTTWTTALRIEAATGRVTAPAGTLREKLAAARVYHVDATGGSDTQDGLSAGAAFASLQKAMDVVADLDLGGHNVTVNLADGTYGGVALRSLTGDGTVIFSGNAAGTTVTGGQYN